MPQVCFRWPPAQAPQDFDLSSFASAHNRFLTGRCISGTLGGVLLCCVDLTTPQVCLRCEPAHAAHAELPADEGVPPSDVALMMPQGAHGVEPVRVSPSSSGLFVAIACERSQWEGQ